MKPCSNNNLTSFCSPSNGSKLTFNYYALDMVAIIALAGYTFFGALLIWLLNTFTITEEEISSYPTAHAHYHEIDHKKVAPDNP